MKQQDEYRKWPNVKAIEYEIQKIGLKLGQALDENEIMALRYKLNRLVSQRYDQIQFNKELYFKKVA